MQQFRHGPDARSDQDFFGSYFAFFACRAVTEGQDLQAVALADGNRVFIEADVHAVTLELLEDERRYGRIFLGQEADIVLDHGDLGAGGIEDVGEFTANRAAADDDQALVGLFRIRRAEERFRRQIACFFQARQGGDVRPAASGDENLIARQSDVTAVIQGDGDSVVVDERRRAVEGVDIGELVVITLNSRTFIDFFPQPLR